MAKKKRSPWIDRITYGATRGLLGLFAVTPEWILYPALDHLGRLYIRCSRRRREIAMKNVERALGDKLSESERRRIVIRSCGYNFMVLGDLARSRRMIRKRRHDERVAESAAMFARIRERANELAPGKAVIVNTPHLGSWEIAGIELITIDKAAEIIARPLSNPLLQEWILASRSQLGIRVHPRRGGVRKLHRALIEGRSVGLLPDQNQRTRGLFVPVFGELASCDRSPARLAQLTGCALAVIACFRVGRRYRFRMDESGVFASKPGEEGLADTTSRLQRAVEELILRHPEQYFWVHDRYRTRPPEGDSSDSEAGEVASDVASSPMQA